MFVYFLLCFFVYFGWCILTMRSTNISSRDTLTCDTFHSFVCSFFLSPFSRVFYFACFFALRFGQDNERDTIIPRIRSLILYYSFECTSETREGEYNLFFFSLRFMSKIHQRVPLCLCTLRCGWLWFHIICHDHCYCRCHSRSHM